uniref:Uncharacterized protein n=1 Tax=Oryza sativa subsp. japonica TaxID=39947 RepID=Q2QVB2_ORYSJ|nr:hypothetical protein LOC_Os12g13410 [Oryza sativa Japonica Group]
MAQGFGQRSSGEGDRPVARWWPAWQEREKESLESSAVEGERATAEVGSERRRDTWLWWRQRGEVDDGAGFVLPLAEKGGAHTRRPWQRWAVEVEEYGTTLQLGKTAAAAAGPWRRRDAVGGGVPMAPVAAPTGEEERGGWLGRLGWASAQLGRQPKKE